MRRIGIIRRMCWYGALLGAVGALSLSAGAQQQPDSQAPPPAQNKQQTQHKTAAQENPFPSDVSQHAAQQKNQSSQPSSALSQDAPDAAPQTQKPKSAAEENPFPEDVSKSAAAAKDSASGDSGSSSSSSSSSSSNPDGDLPPDGDVPRDNGRRRLEKPSDKDIQSGSLAGQGRAAEDVRVGRFYLGTGDYKGAYSRFVEATRLDPANLDAIYGLAASAAGLHRTDEALTNYKLYLQIAPDGGDAKSARKAIRQLSK